MTLLFLNFRPTDTERGAAIADWPDVDARLRRTLPRVRHRFGVQEVWAHERFFLRVMLTAMPSPHVGLTIFSRSGPPPLEDDTHPIWPLLARLAEDNGWTPYAQRPGTTEWSTPLTIPTAAFAAPLPDDHTDRIANAVAAVDLSDLDAVPWSTLPHAFGPATDVPQLLVAVGSNDPHARREAFRSLYGNIFHQGTTYPATVAAVPFLLRILREGPADGVRELLHYFGTIGENGGDVVTAMAEAEGLFATIADDADRCPDERIGADRVLACLAAVSESAAARIERRITELGPGTHRDDLLYFLANQAPSSRWRRVFEDALATSPHERRLAAAIALARHEVLTGPVLDVLFRTIQDPSPFTAWTSDEASWRVYDHAPDDLAFDELVNVKADAWQRAIDAAGGRDAAFARWPDFAEVDARRPRG